MKELALKYGCNPNQKPARIFMTEGELPIEVLNGKPGYINFCDAFNSWQLVKALKKATGMPAAASFKHVSPAGAALGKPLTDVEKQMYFVEADHELSPIACAYIRARGADRLCSYGDWAALSDVCDADTASYLAHEVSAELSGGQRQRAFLAMVLAQNTPVVLLDEPTTYLDINHQVDLMRLMGELRTQGKTVVAVLHDLNQASRYCDQLVVMANGHVMAQGTPEEVMTPGLLRTVFSVEAEIHPEPVSGRPMCLMR